MYLDNVKESLCERAVTTLLSVNAKSCSLEDCPKDSVAQQNIVIIECLNIIAAYVEALAFVAKIEFLRPGTNAN